MKKIQQLVVGGATRDVLLGFEPKDIDFVWTGIDAEFLINKGMTQVGAGFPVFLDHNGDEHALARTERKTDVGYNGFECQFDPSITIEQDLERRDLTCNSMAVKIEDWDSFKVSKCRSLVIDPFNGMQDLDNGILRHTSDAFSEDPIRVLRTARFSARYNFRIDIDTIVLMNQVVFELNSVPTERIWAEFQKGLMEKYPFKLFIALSLCDAFRVDVMKPFNLADSCALSECTESDTIDIRFALSAFGFSKDDYSKLSIPNECSSLSMLVNDIEHDMYMFRYLTSEQKLDVLTKARVFNNNSLLDKVIRVMRLKTFNHIDSDTDMVIQNTVNAVRSINAQEVAAQCKTGQEIKEKLYNLRVEAINRLAQ